MVTLTAAAPATLKLTLAVLFAPGDIDAVTTTASTDSVWGASSVLTRVWPTVNRALACRAAVASSPPAQRQRNTGRR